ncbi:MAG TPA: amino acid ABC transporter permease [Firmicutes bacterium]|nr:amino acid ABC transporter permease [Bacillota bacterium]
MTEGIWGLNINSLLKLVPHMVDASLTTLNIFFLTLIFAVPLGFVICFGRMSKYKPVRKIVEFYLLIMRGTPLILQLIFFFYGVFPFFGLSLPRFWAAIFAFVLNYAAYFCEIFRSGLESMPRGQREAAAVLGFTKTQTFFRILLPQVIKRILPPMGSECMTLVKDTALAQVIGVAELFQLANSSVSREASIIPIFVAGVFYLLMNGIVSRCFSALEKRLNYYQ